MTQIVLSFRPLAAGSRRTPADSFCAALWRDDHLVAVPGHAAQAGVEERRPHPGPGSHWRRAHLGGWDTGGLAPRGRRVRFSEEQGAAH